MTRSLKILFAFCCCALGYILSTDPQAMISTDSEWLYQVLSTFGFILMMASGLYTILKLARPFVCPLNEVNDFHGTR